jgi:hypothetical protein
MDRREEWRLRVREFVARRAYRKRVRAFVVREQREQLHRYRTRPLQKGLLRKPPPSP